MKKKGFTLVELLVVIAIIALLMGILMPALARVRQIAYRLYCGTNLSGIGKAMLIYSNDYDDEFPAAGLSSGNYYTTQVAVAGTPARLAQWNTLSPTIAFANGGTVSSCFYLLIKYAEVGPKSFLCKGDSGVGEFIPSELQNVGDVDIADLMDFGPRPIEHCSYSYHQPFSDPNPTGNTGAGYSLTSSSDPGMAVCADPNPWQSSAEAEPRDTFGAFVFDGSREELKQGNAVTHQYDGQNVLFVDGHTSFEKGSNTGVDNDNIYTFWAGGVMSNPSDVQRQLGTQPGSPGAAFPMSRNDSLLLTDGYGASGGGTGR